MNHFALHIPGKLTVGIYIKKTVFMKIYLKCMYFALLLL